MMPIVLSGAKGDKLALDIAGYQCPGVEDGYDANRLTVNIEASNEEGDWAASSSCLLTWELDWFARWLSHVVDGEMESDRFCGMENDLEFVHIASDGIYSRFAVCLKHALSQHTDPAAVSVVNVQLSPHEHATAVQYVRAAILRCPRRGETGRRSSELPGPQKLRDEEAK